MRTMFTSILIALVLVGVTGCGKRAVQLTETDRTLAVDTGVPDVFLAQVKGMGQHLRRLQGVNASNAPGVSIDVPREKIPALP